MKNYRFEETISKEVLENYLSRSVTAAGLFESETLSDDLRVIKDLGVKFLGRASGIWYVEMDDNQHFQMTEELADKVHQVDPDIILQACIFECIVECIEDIKIPEYVFSDFGMEPEDRTFRLCDTLFLEKPKGYIFKRKERNKNGGIPDLSRIETQMWFYYRATSYINCGFEALHMGQIHLYTANDRGLIKTQKVFQMIRDYGRKHARRHKVLLDAHTHGININGELLFDYHAMPFTRVPLMEVKGNKLVLVREGYSEGGKNPNGWSAQEMPYLMEYDNWGGQVVENRDDYTREELAKKDWWGYDQIAWFANQNEKDRNHFLEYTYRWLEINNINGYFEVPFRRMLGDGYVVRERADNGQREVQNYYQINRQSKDCPMGFSQEEMVKELWKSGHELREKACNPQMQIWYGARDEFDKQTGIKLPEKIVVYGSFQPFAGAIENDSNSEVTRMYYIGDGNYVLSVLIPFAGTYDYSISTYGTLSATYQDDPYPRSGSSAKAEFVIQKDNTAVKFTYNFIQNRVTVETY